LLCPVPCAGLGHCRLGVMAERLDDDGVARFEFVCPEEHFNGKHAHAGWATSVFAEMVGHALILSGGFGFLGTLNVRFLKPVPVSEPLDGSAHVDRREGRKIFVNAEISSPSLGELASASSVLITAPTP
jgi:acyl-coenzyme A thioesterase PaaI-like protein